MWSPSSSTHSVAGAVTLDLVSVAPSGQSPPSQGPVVKENVLPEEPSNEMPTLQSPTTFQVVNVDEDLDTEEAEDTGIYALGKGVNKLEKNGDLFYSYGLIYTLGKGVNKLFL